jgi:hypothetical protein
MQKLKYFPLALCGLFCLKTLVLGVSWSEATVIIALSALSFAFEKYSQDSTIAEIKTEQESFKKHVITELEHKTREITELKTGIGGVKLAMNGKSNRAQF